MSNQTLDARRNLISQTGTTDALSVDAAVALKMHDDLLAAQPEGARHDSDICPFCAEKASQMSTASDPSGSGRPDVSKSETKSTEGGTNPTMTDISQETHEALLKKAVDDAVKATEAALATKTEEAASAATRVKELETANADLKSDNDRLNKELDEAQVKLTSATEEVANLKKDAAEAEEKAKLTELAHKRGEQVKNLGLFSDEYVAEKASSWASFDEAAWTERVEEWKQLKPASANSTDEAKGKQDTASAMTGTSEELTKEQQDAAAAGSGDDTKPKSRRAVLGLV